MSSLENDLAQRDTRISELELSESELELELVSDFTLDSVCEKSDELSTACASLRRAARASASRALSRIG